MMHSRIFLVLALLAPWAVAAETLFLTDRLEIPLRADFTDSAATLKTLESGAALEVLERYGSLARVRDREGAEGWVDGRYLTTQSPAREQLRGLKSDLERARAQVVQLQTQLDRGQTAPAAADPAAKKLEGELAEARAELARTQAALAQAQARPTPAAEPARLPAETPPAGDESGSTVLWVLGGFAMLLVGFVAGIVWVRESIRRRMGGMYLRV
jgi:hypothetical protein